MVRVQVVLTILCMEMLFIKAVHWNHKPEVRTLCLVEGRGGLTEFMMRRGGSQR